HRLPRPPTRRPTGRWARQRIRQRDRLTMAAHQFLNPDNMSPPVGFSHVAVTAPGRLVFVAGQTAHQPDGALAGATLPEQFAAALFELVATAVIPGPDD